MAEFRAWRRLAPILAVLLLGVALRGYHIDAQPFRGDEAFSVTFAQLPWDEMIAVWAQGEPHPPLHFLFLRGWMPLAGESDLAVRWPGALAGGLTIALTYQLGRAWFGRRAGLLAALLTAINPFLIWYAQDGRMYPFMTVFVLLALRATWRAAHVRRWQDWLIAGLWWLVNLFNHYFAAFALAAVGAALVLSPRTRHAWRPALAMAVGVALAYLPWAWFVSGGLAAQSKDWPMNDIAWRVLTAYSVGVSEAGAVGWSAAAGALVLGALALLGVIAGWRRRPTETLWLTSLAIGVPLLCWAITAPRSAFTERFVISAVPAALLLAAVGLNGIQERLEIREAARLDVSPLVRGLALSVLAVAALLSLQRYHFDPAYRKSPDWHSVIRYLQETARADEVVVVNLPDPAFFHYYRNGLPVETSPPAPLNEDRLPETVAQLERLRDSYQHIRFFFQPSPGYDPNGFVGAWLAACCEQTDDRFVSRFRVQSFDTPSASLAARVSLSIEFEQGIRLTGYRFVASEVRAGDEARLTLYWTTRAPVAASYTVFVHVLAADGFQVLGADGPPRGGARLTTQWATEETVIDPRLIHIPGDMPAGEYAVEVGLYQLETGQRLRTGEGDSVRLPQSLRVVAP